MRCVVAQDVQAAVRPSATLASALLVAGKARADNWEFNPRVEVGGQYNDNYRLAESGTPKRCTTSGVPSVQR